MMSQQERHRQLRVAPSAPVFHRQQQQQRRRAHSIPPPSAVWTCVRDDVDSDAADNATFKAARVEWRKKHLSGSARVAQSSSGALAELTATGTSIIENGRENANSRDTSRNNQSISNNESSSVRQHSVKRTEANFHNNPDSTITHNRQHAAATRLNISRPTPRGTSTTVFQDPDPPSAHPGGTIGDNSTTNSESSSRSDDSRAERLPESNHSDNNARRARHQSGSGCSGDSGGLHVGENMIGEWSQHETLGRGAHGVVYRGVVACTGEHIAVKQIHTNGMHKQELQAAENEIRMGYNLRHPNVVRFLGIEKAGEHLNIFLEYLDGGSLRAFLKKEGRLSEEQTADITKKMLSGLQYLHSQGITHRDIKAANVLLSKSGHVKLADFGTSKQTTHDSVMSGLKGTPHWMAPEVIRAEEPLDWLPADVWSVGCTVVEMLTGKTPWPNIPNVMAAMYHISKGESPPIDTEVSLDARSFVAACCAAKPQERHTVEELMNHTFLRKISSPARKGLFQATSCDMTSMSRIRPPTPLIAPEYGGQRQEQHEKPNSLADRTGGRMSGGCCNRSLPFSRANIRDRAEEPCTNSANSNDSSSKSNSARCSNDRRRTLKSSPRLSPPPLSGDDCCHREINHRAGISNGENRRHQRRRSSSYGGHGSVRPAPMAPMPASGGWPAPVTVGRDENHIYEVKEGNRMRDARAVLLCRRSRSYSGGCGKDKDPNNGNMAPSTASKTCCLSSSQSPVCEKGSTPSVSDISAVSRGPLGLDRTSGKQSPRERRFHERRLSRPVTIAKKQQRLAPVEKRSSFASPRRRSSSEGSGASAGSGLGEARACSSDELVHRNTHSSDDCSTGSEQETAVGGDVPPTSGRATAVEFASMGHAWSGAADCQPTGRFFGSPIAVSPVASHRRHSSPSAGHDVDSERQTRCALNGGISRRQGSGYNSPLSVVQAAREHVEQGTAGQERPGDPLTGEYIQMDRSGNSHGANCWKSDVTKPTGCMRTKSAGVLGGLSKLPPLEHDSPSASNRKLGPGGTEDAIGQVRPGRTRASPRTRLINSAPPLAIESSPGPIALYTAGGGDIIGSSTPNDAAGQARTIHSSQRQPVLPVSSSLFFPPSDVELIHEGPTGHRRTRGGGDNCSISAAVDTAGEGGEVEKRSGLVESLSASPVLVNTETSKITDRFPAGRGEYATSRSPILSAGAMALTAAAADDNIAETIATSMLTASTTETVVSSKHASGDIGSPLNARSLHRTNTDCSGIQHQLLRPVLKNEGLEALKKLAIRRTASITGGAPVAEGRTGFSINGVIGDESGSSIERSVGGVRGDSFVFSEPLRGCCSISTGSLSPLLPAAGGIRK